MKERQKPKEEGAPAYMAQYTALMTILLAFFICMMTLGKQKAAEYKKTGFGYIRDSFGMKGGIGLMPYWKEIMPGQPNVTATNDNENADLLGYPKGMFQASQLDADGIRKCEIANRGHRVRIATPVVFASGRWDLDESARVIVRRIGGVLYDMPDCVLTACCLETGEDTAAAQLLAARRAAAITGYIEDNCGISRDRLRSLGYAHNRYLKTAADDADRNSSQGKDGESEQMLFFLVSKRAPSSGS